MRRALPLLLALTTSPAWAEEDPTRVVDRMFFSLSGGASQASARGLTDVGGTEHRALVAPYAWKANYAVGVWPAEWIGLELSTGAQSLALGNVGSADAPVLPHGVGLQVVPSVRLALPLHWIAPYVGAGFAVFFPLVYEQRGAQAWKGSPGVLFGPRFFGGANVYFSRDLRFFVDVEVMTLDATAPMSATGNLSGTQRWDGVVIPSASIGFAYTPDAFKQSPSKALWVLGALAPALLTGLFGFLAVDGARK